MFLSDLLDYLNKGWESLIFSKFVLRALPSFVHPSWFRDHRLGRAGSHGQSDAPDGL